MGQEECGLSPSIVVGRVLDCVMLDKLRGVYVMCTTDGMTSDGSS